MKVEAKRRAWRRRRENPDTRADLLHAAGVAFARDGYEGASLTAIAKTIGVTAPSIYHHFKSKNELLFTFLDTYAALMRERCEAATASVRPPTERLAAFVRAHVTTDLEHHDTVPVVNLYFQHGTGAERALTRTQRAHLTACYRALFDQLRDIISMGIGAGEFHAPNATTATFAILGLISNVVYWYRPEGPLTAEAVAGQLAHYALATLGRRTLTSVS